MRLFRSPDVIGIATETIQFALDVAAETHPNEFMGLLRGTPTSELGIDQSGIVITDVLVIPGTTSSSSRASVKQSFIPNDTRTVGSIHSHPNGVLRPSNTDLGTFGSGTVHIILGAPYGRNDWRAFDQSGDDRALRVIDVDLDDPADFFDFTESDLDLDY